MSQINDALKRAKQAQNETADKAAPGTPPKPAAPVKPAPPTPTPTPPSPQSNLGVHLAIVSALVIAFCLGWYLLRKSEPAAAHEAPKPAALAPAPAPQPAVQAHVEVTNTPVIVPVKPALKLQAIMFDPKRPVALVSGKSVMVGDKLGNFKVRTITSESITLVSATETNVLKLTVRL